MAKNGDVREIRPQRGPGFLQRVFGGKSYLHCLRELLKNCRDWGAVHIQLFTEDAREKLRIVDDGSGMDGDNRDAFCSVNATTAFSSRQAGKFCTGTKQMLFSHASDVTVRTAPKDEPDVVYVFSFTRDEYEDLVFLKQRLVPDRLTKNEKTWPHPFPFGTEIVYTIHTESRRRVPRGAKLATELAALLPIGFQEIVRVDGVPLPPKRILGESYNQTLQTSLGEVVFELYRPEDRRSSEELLLTGVEIGEVPMKNLLRVLDADQREKVPPVFLLPEVCGTIRAEFLKEHGNEDRFTLDSSISEDPRTRQFLRLLGDVAPLVELRLKLRKSSGDPSVIEMRFHELARHLNELYGKGAVPEGGRTESTDDHIIEEPDPPDPPIDPPPIQLLLCDPPRHEFSLGEPIEVTVKMRPDIAKSHQLSELQWYCDRSRARDMRKNAKGATMRASEIGHGMLRVDIPGTGIGAQTHYEVVTQRVFRMANPNPTTSRGNLLPIMTRNHDLLREAPVWRLDGVGTLRPEGRRAMYHATNIGSAVITAQDPDNRNVFATCDVTVVGQPRRMVNIRGHWFEYVFMPLGERRPVSMIRGDKIHRLHVNLQSAGFTLADTRGDTTFLTHAIATEFMRFRAFQLSDEAADRDPRDFERTTEMILDDSDRLYAEMLKK